MAIIFLGNTPCGLCGEVLKSEDEIVAFTAFLPRGHPLHRYSDGAFHSHCFQEWPDAPEFERLYRDFRNTWESRPRNLTSLEEMEAWGRNAFPSLHPEEDRSEREKEN